MHYHLTFLLVALLSSCATTTFYHAGQPVARFQGDMDGAAYSRAADGSISWTAARVDHSPATIAGGNAISKGVMTTGTAIATSGIPALIK